MIMLSITWFKLNVNRLNERGTRLSHWWYVYFGYVAAHKKPKTSWRSNQLSAINRLRIISNYHFIFLAGWIHGYRGMYRHGYRLFPRIRRIFYDFYTRHPYTQMHYAVCNYERPQVCHVQFVIDFVGSV